MSIWCSFLSKSWTMVFLQHFTFSHDSVVWNLTFVFAQARSGSWHKKASASMSRSDLVCKTAGSSACKLQALQVQCHGNPALLTFLSLYQYIILYHRVSSISSDTFWHLQHPWLWPLCTMKPRKPATCMMRGFLHKCTSCDIATSAENG